MDNNLRRSFEILEISQDATYEEAKAAYRLLAQVWHPDKHSHSEKLHAKATSKFKELNTAWNEVEEYLKNAGARESAQRDAERRASADRERAQQAEQKRDWRDATEDRQQRHGDSSKKADYQNFSGISIIACPSCSTKNRVPYGRYFEAICGSCGCFLHRNKSKNEEIEIDCPKCGTTNRIPGYTPLDIAMCRRCSAKVFSTLDTEPNQSDIKFDSKNQTKIQQQIFKDQSGLMWVRNAYVAGETMTWKEAMNWVKEFRFCGYSDWRLPSRIEFEHFVDQQTDLQLIYGRDKPHNQSSIIHNKEFKNVQDTYWTCNEVGVFSAWNIFIEPFRTDSSFKYDYRNVWPVRGTCRDGLLNGNGVIKDADSDLTASGGTRQSVIKEDNVKTQLGMKWFKTYIYFYLPVTILWTHFVVDRANRQTLVEAGYTYQEITRLTQKTGFEITIIYAITLLTVVVIAGLHLKKEWAWELNWFLLIVICLGVAPTQNMETGSIAVAIFLKLLIIFLPNYFYFTKRKHLFT